MLASTRLLRVMIVVMIHGSSFMRNEIDSSESSSVRILSHLCLSFKMVILCLGSEVHLIRYLELGSITPRSEVGPYFMTAAGTK